MKLTRGFIFDPSLVLYLPLWKLDGASFMSRDAYGHLCTKIGALWRPNGHYFDGTDDTITLADTASLRATVNTHEIWLKIGGQAAGAPTRRIIMVKHATDRLGLSITYVDATHVDMEFIADTAGAKSARVQNWVADNEWHHWVGTFDSTRTRLYRDAVLIDTGDSDDTWTDTGTTLKIMGGAVGRYVVASMGELREYNRALTPLEIQHNYLAIKWRYR